MAQYSKIETLVKKIMVDSDSNIIHVEERINEIG